MKKQKLKLDNLQITSFVTQLNESEKITVAAGDGGEVNGFWDSWLISGCVFSLACPVKPVVPPALDSVAIRDCDQLKKHSQLYPTECLVTP